MFYYYMYIHVNPFVYLHIYICIYTSTQTRACVDNTKAYCKSLCLKYTCSCMQSYLTYRQRLAARHSGRHQTETGKDRQTTRHASAYAHLLISDHAQTPYTTVACIYVCMCIYICGYIHRIHVHISVRICKPTYVHMNVYTYMVCVHAYECVCVHGWMYV